jgi:chaperonin cofactor prefoldin
MLTTQIHDDKIKELKADVNSLNFRMDAVQSNINEMREQFRELEVLLAKLGLVREGLK